MSIYENNQRIKEWFPSILFQVNTASGHFNWSRWDHHNYDVYIFTSHIKFLTECDIHTEIRQRFVSNIKSHIDGYEDLPANGKFVTVMRSSSEVVIKELAKFVYKAFQQRLHHV